MKHIHEVGDLCRLVSKLDPKALVCKKKWFGLRSLTVMCLPYMIFSWNSLQEES